MTPKLPEELWWIQQLLDRRGVAGTLRLLAVACFDRIEGKHGHSIQDLSERAMWNQLGKIVATAAELGRRDRTGTVRRD